MSKDGVDGVGLEIELGYHNRDLQLRGYNPLLATLSTPLAAPVIAATRRRSGNAGSARGAANMIAETITTARACGATGEIVLRADSAFYAKTVITACRRRRVRFSVTTRIDAKIRTACESIADNQWIDIDIRRPSGTRTPSGGSPTRRSPRPSTPRSSAPATR
ncbi:transposase [Micromonospora sp. WMMA1363]|uniref:transposase n=1 Tax=Micromonospora sp. WMMA1363 TaxID=3053985 RepID=UPI00259C6E9D|nr:transposase [Micromonospora sp. WMMA1363]MDM4721875.1 transposase [Micromonospora sp. WMMA1363]